jgi:hypothetical protein
VFPVQTTAAEAVIAEKAKTLAPITVPISALLNDTICYSVFLIFWPNYNASTSSFVPISRSKTRAKKHRWSAVSSEMKLGSGARSVEQEAEKRCPEGA